MILMKTDTYFKRVFVLSLSVRVCDGQYCVCVWWPVLCVRVMASVVRACEGLSVVCACEGQYCACV